MRYHKLGSSDLMVSEVCLGTMTFGHQNTEAESHALLSEAMVLGINFIDTAEMYPVPSKRETSGTTEKYIGTWIAKKVVPRDKFILATKVSGYDANGFVASKRTDPPGPDQPSRLDGASIKAALNASLKRLQTDYVDLFQLHWPDRYCPNFGKSIYDESQERKDAVSFEDIVRALGELIKEGKIRYWGVCNETTYGVAELFHAAKHLGVPPPVSVQNCYNLMLRTFETELAEACAPSHYNLGLLPWSPLAGGVLTGKYLGDKPHGSRNVKYPEFQARFFKNQTQAAVKEYTTIARRFGLTPVQLALGWCRSRRFVASTIIGATRLDQLCENVAAFEVELPADCIELINTVHRMYRNPVLED